MWIVAVVESWYPSVFHFDTEDEARIKFEQVKDRGHVSHIAKVQHTFIDKEYLEEYGRDVGDIKSWDVDHI